MYPLGLNGSARSAYLACLASSHGMRVRVSLLNLAETEIADLTDYLYDGQVNVDTTGETDRSLTLSLFDPRARLSFDPDSPADSALFMNRMIRVTYGVYVDTTVGWVDVPVFTGPITKLDRPADELVGVECQGKETIARRAAWHTLTLKKGHRKVSAIRTVLHDRAGESSFDLPDLDSRLGRTISVGRTASPWRVATKIAESMGKVLYYDGDGVCRLREPSPAVFTFKPGDGGTILTPVQVSYDLEGFANIVRVNGGEPRGKKPHTPRPHDGDARVAHVPGVQWTEMLDAGHPLSAARLGRVGSAGGFILKVVDNDKIRSTRLARIVANRELDRAVLAATNVSFEAVPLPMLEPGDLIAAKTDDGTVRARLDQFSLPLKVGSNMTVGFLKNVSTATRRHRR